MTAQTFEELYVACRGQIHSGILRYVRNSTEADEATAAAFAAAFEKRESFRGEATFFTWVYRIALNQVHSRARHKNMLPLDAMPKAGQEAFIHPDLMDAAIERGTCFRRIREALRKVPLKYRRVLVDRFVRGYSTIEVAELHGIPAGTVLSRLYKAKRLLRDAWQG